MKRAWTPVGELLSVPGVGQLRLFILDLFIKCRWNLQQGFKSVLLTWKEGKGSACIWYLKQWLLNQNFVLLV